MGKGKAVMRILLDATAEWTEHEHSFERRDITLEPPGLDRPASSHRGK